MSSGDLGMVLGLIFSPIVGLYLYNEEFGLLTSIGVTLVLIYILGFILGFIIDAISSFFQNKV